MKILIVCHEDLIPPRRVRKGIRLDDQGWRTEHFVAEALREAGHQVEFCGLYDDLSILRRAIQTYRPDIAFNLLEEWAGEALLEPALPAFLAAYGVCYTGVGTEGLVLARSKSVAKVLLAAAGVPVAREGVFPAIVKSRSEHSSQGLKDSSVVRNSRELKRETRRMRKLGLHDVFAEEYVDGRELSVGVIGRMAFEPIEMSFGKKPGPKFATEKVKWSERYREKYGISIGPARGLSRAEIAKLKRLARKACLALEIDGPARVDFRVRMQGVRPEFICLEVNPNPDLARFDEFAVAARRSGIEYAQLLGTIIRLGLKRK